ncbi:MAG: CAP domain-containing protein [Rhodospirillales bacterium]|nr:CAP domain-containing protein [Rhodospirillales bacterium]
MLRLILVFLALLTGFSARAETDAALDLLAGVNALRREHGLPSLRFEPNLSKAAQDYARELAAWGQLSHQGPDGSSLQTRLESRGYAYRLAAENLACGLIGAQETVGLWQDSPGHRKNMLLAEMREAGVGMDRAKDGQTYWTLLLGRRMSDRAEQPNYDDSP